MTFGSFFPPPQLLTLNIYVFLYKRGKYKIGTRHTHNCVSMCFSAPFCFQGKSWEEVNHFTSTETFPIIVKPVESAGSDGVKLCHSLEEADFGGAREISSDDFEGKTFLKHISGYFCTYRHLKMLSFHKQTILMAQAEAHFHLLMSSQRKCGSQVGDVETSLRGGKDSRK